MNLFRLIQRFGSMKNNLFSIGTVFSFEQHKFIVSQIKKDGIKASNLRNNETLEITYAQGKEFIDSKALIFQKDSLSHKGLSFEDLSQEEQDLALKKLKLLELLAERRITKISGTDKTKQAILELSPIVGFTKAPHWQSVRKWLSELTNASGKIKGLYTNKNLRGNKKHRLSSIVMDIMENEIDKFIRPSQPRVSTLCRNIETEIIKYNLDNPANVQKVPTRNTIVKRLNKINLERRQRASKGSSTYQLGLADSIAPYSTTHILERVEIDHTLLDIHLIHDLDSTLIGRPTLTALSDYHSGMVFGLQTSFEATSFAAISSACLNAFLPKEEELEKLNIQGNWPTHGIPETLVTDNGNEFWSNNFSEMGMQLGMVIQYAPIRHPNYKGSIERFFGSVNTLFLDDLPGVVRKPHKKNDRYDPRQEALMTFTKFKHDFYDWIVNVYNNEPNEDGATPKEIWNSSAKQQPIPIEDKLEIELSLLASHSASLMGHGISFLGLKYNSDALKSLFRRDGKHKVNIKINPYDLGEVLVLDSKELVYITVPCLEYSYAKGVSIYEHREYKRVSRKYKNQKLNNQDLMQAKIRQKDERDRMREQNKRRKTQVTTQKHSRIEKVGIPTFDLLPSESISSNDVLIDQPASVDVKTEDWDIE